MGFRVILAINTSSLRFSIALMKGNGGLIGQYTLADGPKGSRPLFPALHELLVQTNLDLRKAEAVAVAGGPGSFTGLRVGVSMAKGFCQAMGIPFIAVPTLEALASQLSHTAYPVCPVIGSRKGEVFAALFRSSENGEMIRMTEDVCLKVTGLSELVREKTVFIGDHFDSQAPGIQKALGRNALLAPCSCWSPTAAPVGAIALRRFRNGDTDDLEDYSPNYLRPPEVGPHLVSRPEAQ